MKAISIPFRLDGFGKVAVSTTPESVWAARVRSVIGTPLGSRVMRPSFGSAVADSLMNASLPGFIETAVRSATAQWLPDVLITDVRFEDSRERDSEISAEIVYQIPESAIDNRSYSVRIF